MATMLGISVQIWALVLLSSLVSCHAKIRQSVIRGDDRSLIMFENFGFTNKGKLELSVSDLQLEAPEGTNLSLIGFFMSTSEEFLQAVSESEKNPGQCILDSNSVINLVRLHEIKEKIYNNTYSVPKAGEYFIFLANCQPQVKLGMKVTISTYNLKSSNKKDYLSIGQTQLPILYFSFFIIYVVATGAWLFTCVKRKENVHRIHVLMGILVFVKALNLLTESEDELYTERTGTGHGWDMVFYIMGLLKGVMLFTVLILIGAGWSYLKPYLQGREKKVLMVVIPFQVLANIASIELEEMGPAEVSWTQWKHILLLIDLVCCIGVLLPIAWSIRNLRAASRTDGKAAINLAKLSQFRIYYIAVAVYLYSTRILASALSSVVPYQFEWTRYLGVELVTLAFYCLVGYKMRPPSSTFYITLEDDEERVNLELDLDML